MAAIKKFEDIKAWQEARRLLNRIYGITDGERFSKDWELRKMVNYANYYE